MSERKALILLTKDPAKFVEHLGTMNTEGRRRFSEALTEASQAAQSTLNKAQKNAVERAENLQRNENVPLNSTWISSGSYEPTDASGLAGYLTLHLKTGKSYIYPAVSRLVWETMKSARGNPGAGTAFWALYLRGARTSSPGFSLFRSALKLSGLEQRVEAVATYPVKKFKSQVRQVERKATKLKRLVFAKQKGRK